MAEPTNPAELLPNPETILSVESQQWYPSKIKDCHQVIRGLAADLAGEIQENQRLRRQVKLANEYFTQTREIR